MEYSKGKILEGKILHVDAERKFMLVKFPSKETGILHKSKMSPQPEGDLTNFYHRNQSILVSIDGITAKGYTLGRKDIENRYENQLRHEAKELEKQKRAAKKERMQKKMESSASQFKRGGVYEAEVIKLSNQGAKINIAGIDGYIKKEDLNWNENESVKESLFEGEIIHAVFLEYTDGKLLFGLKYLEEKPYDDNLYSLSTEELLKRLGHNNNVFIAEAKNIKGLCLTNLYSEEGNLLIDPVKGNNIVVRFIQPTIEEGKFYKVSVELQEEEKRRKSNDLFSFFVSNVEEVENPYKSDVRKAFSWHDSPASNSSLANIIDTIGLEMYSSAERMFFELIQNADDSASQAGVIINIDQKDNYLIFTHNGLHFSYKDFESLVSAAKSTKSSKEKTGYKGIGFKSVFTNSQQVFVDSGGYHFKFDKYELLYEDFDKFYSIVRNISGEQEMSKFVEKYATQREAFRGVKDIPWQLLPIWCDVIPETLKNSAFAKNQKVSFALNIKNQKIEDYVKAIEFLFNNPKFILFLRHTNRLDLKFANKTITKDVKNDIVTIKNSFANKRIEELIKRDYEDIPISNEAFENKYVDIQIKEITNRQGEKENKFYDNNNQELEDIPDRIASSKTTTISFVANYDEGIITENKGNSLYAYLPMNEHRFRFPFYINADFVLAANRETLLDSPWNYYLLANIGQLLVAWVTELANNGERNCLKLLPLQYFDDSTLDVEKLAQSFNSAYRTALETEAFILNHKGKLAKQEDIIIDGTGLSEIVGADLFCQLLETERCLPSEKIDSKILEEDIFEHIKTMKFNDVISAITNNSDFNDWFVSASDEQKKALYKWIDDNDMTSRKDDLRSFVSKLPLFKFGESFKSCEEINYSECIITTEHTEPIKTILFKLSFVCSDNLFHKNHPLYRFVDLQEEIDLFDAIKESDFYDLTIDERKTLFFALEDFDGVGDSRLKNIALFKNMKGEFKPLGEMVAYRENVPIWLFNYVLCKEDDYTELSDYLIAQEDEFDSIIQENISDINTSWADLYETYKEEWTGQFTRYIIDNYEIDDDILTIIKESDTKTKEYFLNNIINLDLSSTETYKEDSYEYRVLQLALSVFSNPSDFSSKICFDGQCIKDFSVSDDVVCDFPQNGKTKKVKLSLAKLLPQYQNKSDSIDKIKTLFVTKKNLDKFFETESKSIYDVHRELNQHLGIPESYFSEWNVDGNAQQYLFATYYRRGIKRWNNLYVPKIDLNNETDTFVYELLNFLFDNSISIEESPFTYHLEKYFIGKYFDSDYIFESEQILSSIEKWAEDDEKKRYLMNNGVQSEKNNAIQFRKLFLENKPIDFIDKLEDDDVNSGIEFVATAYGIDHPFVGDNQKNVLLSLKDKCEDLSDYWDDEKMKKKGKEWNTKEYYEWIEDHIPQIFIYPGALPCQLSYNDETLLCYDDSEHDYYYNTQEKILFVSNVRKMEDILLEVAKEGDSDFDFDDYRLLCLEGKVSISEDDCKKLNDYDKLKTDKEELEKENVDLKRKVEELERQLKKDSSKTSPSKTTIKQSTNPVSLPIDAYAHPEPIVDDSGKGVNKGGVTEDDRPTLNMEARIAAKKYLEGKDEYDCEKWDPSKGSQIVKDVKFNGKDITVVIISSNASKLHLHPYAFAELMENPCNLLLNYINGEIYSLDFNMVFNHNSSVNLIFDAEHINSHEFAFLANRYRFSKKTCFVIANYNYSASEDIKSFGISETKEDGCPRNDFSTEDIFEFDY